MSSPDNAVAAPKLVSLTSSALQKIKQFAAADDSLGKMFRVYIEGGGCSGFQYGFTFDEARDEDSRVQVADVEVLIDPQSAMYLTGSTVDFVEDLRGSGFVVKNPNATGSCGCGTSFSV